MKPIDFSKETYATLKPRLDSLRREVYDAWTKHGPGTTREVSTRSGIDILTFRPRTTELLQLGLIRLVEDGEIIERNVPLEGRDDRAASSVLVTFEHQQHGTEGTYTARTITQWQQWLTQQREEAEKCANGQLHLLNT